MPDAGECRVIAADLGATEPPGIRRLSGEQFDIEFVRFAPGERVVRAPGEAAGEEVAAVLEGTLHVESAGESYWLTVGEGIIIPPGQGSSWGCMTAGGLLYRVVNRGMAVRADE